jgi:hypothetical protein
MRVDGDDIGSAIIGHLLITGCQYGKMWQVKMTELNLHRRL